jgi:hypothetical protein
VHVRARQRDQLGQGPAPFGTIDELGGLRRATPQIVRNLMEEWTVAGHLGLYAKETFTVSADVLMFR